MKQGSYNQSHQQSYDGNHSKALISYEKVPSPRGEHEYDVKTHVEKMQMALRNA